MSKSDRVIHEETHERVNSFSTVMSAVMTGGASLLGGTDKYQETTLTLDDGSKVVGTGSTEVDSKVDAYKKMSD